MEKGEIISGDELTHIGFMFTSSKNNTITIRAHEKGFIELMQDGKSIYFEKNEAEDFAKHIALTAKL